MARLPNAYTSSAMLTAGYHLLGFNVAGKNDTYLGIHGRCPIFFSPRLTKYEYSGKISIIVPIVKFHCNPSSWDCSDTCGEKDREADRQTDGRRDIAKLTQALRVYVNATKKGTQGYLIQLFNFYLSFVEVNSTALCVAPGPMSS